jgi:hypothetical protein
MHGYTGLFDVNTKALLTLSSMPTVITFLHEATMDSGIVVNVNFPNYKESFELATAPSEEYSSWAWDRTNRLFQKINPALLTQEVRLRSRLASRKRDVLYTIIRGINIARYPVATGILLQETVYLNKKIQAERFKDKGYPEERAIEYPLVMQQADFAGVSMQAAADDILFKAKLDDELLGKTELLRLKYFNAVKKAATLEELKSMDKEFTRECFHVRRS